MMDFLKQYLKIISYALLGLVFAFASFYILANAYHYLEIRKDFVADVKTQPMVVDVDTKLKKIESNIKVYDSKKYNGKVSVSKMNIIKQNLEACVENINNSKYRELKEKKKVTIVDVYELRETYENNVYNNCIVSNLYWLVTLDDQFPSKYLVDNKELTKYYFESLKGATAYLKKDLINNSSYFYNTSIASSSVKDNTRDGFYEVMDAYTKATNFVLYVSDWFKMEAEG